MKLVVIFALLFPVLGTLIEYAPGAEPPPHQIDSPEGETPAGWRSPDEVREDFTGGLSLGFSFWWLLVFFILSAVLLVWLAWQQNKGGRWFGRGGDENIEIVARRMFGSRHGVVCVRLRDREFLLGIGGDNVSLISEWRTRDEGMSDGNGKMQSLERQGADYPGEFPV